MVAMKAWKDPHTKEVNARTIDFQKGLMDDDGHMISRTAEGVLPLGDIELLYLGPQPVRK